MKAKKKIAVRLIGWGFLMLGVLAARPAGAHYLWIETSSKVEIYYGEYEESLREKSGGRLDEVGAVQAWVAVPGNARKGITYEKRDNRLEIMNPETLPAGTSLIQVQELDRPVQDWRKHNIGIVKPNFYASALSLREKEGSGDPLLLQEPEIKTVLGMYPVSLGGEIVLKVYFKNNALAGAKVNVHAPNGWTKEWKTGEDGTIRFQPPWNGQYVIEVIQLEKAPGEFQGVAYEAIRHRATFTWTVENAGGVRA